MSATGLTAHQFSVPKLPKVHRQFDPNKPITRIFTRWMQKSFAVRCCKSKTEGKQRMNKNYYELLEVSGNSNPQEIKEAYRKLQKKYHPDIAGQEGHDYTIMLNEAYKILMKDDLRREYDASISHTRIGQGRNGSGFGYSSWRGPVRPQALFVDENACIGCQECVHHSSNTFKMDEALGSARVKVQYGDDERNIEVSVDSCPVNCIHWVESEELEALEFLSQPQLKEGYGIFGQGWERPKNVFMAAKSFSKQQKQQAESNHRYARTNVEQETPAQAEARASASIKLKMERFSRIWNWMKEISGR